MRAKRFFAFLVIVFMIIKYASAQTYLVPVDAPNNKYPITFTDAAQQTLILEFDRAITSGGTSAGWTITVGGSPVVMVGNPVAALNFLRITLPSSISYANRNNVRVSYSAAAGSMSLAGPVEPDFTNIQAVNNYIAVAGDFTNGLYGEIPPVDICAAVLNVEVAMNITVSERYRNSIHYATPRAYTTWMYPSDVPKSQPFFIETGGIGSGVYSVTSLFPAYPDNTTNCTWVVGIYPYIFNSGTLQPNLFVTQNLVKITLPNYKKDNGTPVPGTGDLGLDPPVDDPRTLFCVGKDIINFIFTDATVFDCQLAVEPDLPNTRPRYVQFVYGTHNPAPGIPYVYIDVNGTPVQVTDNNGVAISGVWHVNPDGTANVPGYTTPSGFFEGPVIQYTWDAFSKIMITPMAQTYPISHTGDFINDQAGDIFDVTLRNWGPCNAYDVGNPFTYLDAVTEFSRLRLVTSPPLPTAPNVTICLGSSTNLIAARNGTDPAGVLHWYNNSDLLPSHEVATGNSYNPGIPTPLIASTYNYWVREIVTGGCEGPAKQVVLTIHPVITGNTISAIQTICSGQTPSALSGSGPLGGSGTYTYLWESSTTSSTGPWITASGTSNAQNYSPPALTTTTWYHRIVTSGPCSDISGAIQIVVTPIPTAAISYAGAPFCKSVSTPRAVTLSGTGAYTGGTYSSSAGLTINSSTGAITPSTSTAGTYTVTYTIPASGGCAAVPVTTSVTITAIPTAIISYAGTPFCKTVVGAQSVTRSGTGAYTGGTYTASPAGLTINSSTGAITPSSSTAGTYTVTYTIPASGGCAAVPVTTNVTITALPVATFSYAGTPYCSNAANPLPTFSGGGVAGTFSSTAGLVFVSTSTGQVNLSSSTAGTYTVTNTIAASGGCAQVSATNTITITARPTATISYAGNPFCKTVTTAQPVTISGTNAYTGGAYSASPAGLTINSSTGAITPSTSTAGTYTVTYTIPSGGGCAAIPVITSVTITALPVATFSYTGTPYCSNASNPLPTFSGGGVAGTFSSTAGLVFVSTSTGQVNLAASTAGTYTVTNTIAASGGCASVFATNTITITARPTATISYAGAPFCKTVAAAQPVTISGTGAYTGGNYTASPAGLTINSGTGAITPVTSTAGTYTVTYTIPAGGGCAAIPVTTSLTITAVPTAVISYAGTPFCKSVTTPQPVTLTGTGAFTGGTFSAVPAGLTLNATTGEITPSTSTAGTYTVTYVIPASGGCPAVGGITTSVTITAVPTATISYAGTPFCTSLSTPQPVTISGTGAYTGGTYSSAAGLTINASTGAITPGTSTPGTYTVSYLVPASGFCPAFPVTTTVTITAVPTATISYATPFCTSLSTPQAVTLTGTGAYSGGTFSSTAGLTINASTGAITPSTSTPGTYTVTYVIPASGGCASVGGITTSVTITLLPAATISYAGTPFCKSLAGAQSVTRTGTAGGTYTASPAGLTIDGATGAITPSSSTAGTYTVTYTLAAAGGCSLVTATTTVTITAVPTATISYATPFCTSLSTPQAVTLTGSGAYTGGTFSSTAGLTINGSTGAITPGTSTPGTYIVTYVIPASGGCAAVGGITTSVTITAVPNATINYAGTPFCTSLSTPQTVTITGTGAYTGGTFSSTAGLTINAATGAITPSTSTPGTYTVTYVIPASGGCVAVGGITTSVTITLLPAATISYAGTPFCKSLVGAQSVTRTGTAGGTYTASPAGLTIDGATGAITPSSSTAGTYTVTYTLAAAGGCSLVTATTTVTITAVPTATISYATPFCTSLITPQAVTLTGTGAYTGGTFSSTAGLTINGSTGAITPGTSTPGTYIVTYVIPASGGCAAVGGITTSVTITAVPNATINYAGTPFCTSLSTPQTVTITGTGAYTGGTFSSTAGLAINSGTGTITPGTSTPGTYTVTYTIPSSGGCAAIPVTTSVTITVLPSATISYAGTPFCRSVGTAQSVTISGTGAYTGGTYTSSPSGLSINASTGAITPATSTAGTYIVTYTIPASGGCGSIPVTTSVTITALPAATISYPGSPFCSSVNTPQPVTLTGTGAYTGGTFTSSPAGLAINSGTGEITPGSSTVGTYTVTYTTPASAGCASVPVATMVTITTLPSASISYTGLPWCTIDGVQNVILTGASGGTYSASPSGLTINGITGAITPSTSTPGAYTVSYTISAAGGCGVVTATASVTINLTPLLVITDPAPVCSPNTADLTASSVTAGSTAGLSLSYWTDAGATVAYPTPSAAGAGTYYIKGLSGSGCSDIKPVNVVVVPLPATPAIGGGGKITMCKGTTGQFYSVPFNAGNTYNWSVTPAAPIAGGGTPANNFIALNFPNAGVYTLSVQEFTSVPQVCGGPIRTLTITVYDNPTADAGADHIICEGESVTIGGSPSASGGSGNFTYLWTPSFGLNDATIANPAANPNTTRTYTLHVTDITSGCAQVVETVAVTVNTSPTPYNVTGPDYYCFGTSGITLTLSGSQAGVRYQLYKNTVAEGAPIPGTGSSLSWTDLKTGTYTVKATNLTSTCQNDMNGSVTVAENPDIVINSVTTVEPNCFGSNDGLIAINASGGTGTLSYSINSGATFQSSNTFGGLSQGIYNIVVKDTRGCTKAGSQVLNQPSALSASVSSQTNVRCFSGTDGSVAIAASGGTGPYTYNIDGGGFSGSNLFTGLSAGPHTVIVRDNNLCSAIVNLTITQPTTLAVSTTHVNVLCFGSSTGSATVIPTGGTAPYNYSWNTVPVQTTATASNLSTGTYTVTVTDANNCSTTATVTITQPAAALSLTTNQINVLCFGNSSGSATAVPAGGTVPYSYSWNTVPVQTTATATGLSAGSYTVTVTDNNGCTATASVSITEPAVALSATTTQADVLCYGNSTGSATVITVGGTSPYTDSWNTVPSQTGVTALNMPAGTYTVTVRDANNCTTTANVTITQPSAPLTATTTKVDVLCNGSSTGSATAIPSGGTGPYTYSWNTVPVQTGVTATNLAAGNYSVTVTDNNGCTVTANVTISQSTALSITTTSVNVICFGNSTGSATATATSGVGPYTYSWNTVPAQTTATANNLSAGTYTVTVTDVNSCSATATVTIIQPSAAISLNTSQVNVLCFGNSTGSATAIPSGGTGPYAYSWNTVPVQTTATANNLTAGTYTVTVTDANSCSATAAVSITEPAELTLSMSQVNVLCNGNSTGTATATPGGGTGTYFYSWYRDAGLTNPLGQFASTAIYLAAGTYYVKVTDLNGCIISGSVIISQPTALNAAVTSQTNADCFGNATGSVTVEAVAGSGTSPYEYSIDGGATYQLSGTYNSLAAMPYTVLVKDTNGCIKPVPFTIIQPMQLAASITSITHVSCFSGNDGSVTITPGAGSGTAPYSFSINGTTWVTPGTFSGLNAGSYNLFVRDAHNCTVNIPVVITQPPLLELNPGSDVLLDCFGDKDGTGTFYAVGGTPGYTFTEVFNSASAAFAGAGFNYQTIFNAGAGVVTVRVRDSKSCTAEASTTFTQPALLMPGSITANQVLCYGEDPARLEEGTAPTGGPAPFNYLYQWQYSYNMAGLFINIPGANLNEFTPPAGATGTLYYRRMVTSGFCEPVYSNIVEVLVNPRPIARLTGGETICPGQSSIIKVTMLAGTGPFTLDIANFGTVTNYTSGADIVVMPAVTTTYTLTRVRDANNCEVVSPSANISGVVTVYINELPSITLFTPSAPVCEFTVATFNVIAQGTNLTYQWWLNDGTNLIPLTNDGTYFGATSPTLMIFNTDRSMNGYVYHVVVSGCGTDDQSDDAILTVNMAPELTLHPSDTVICLGENAVMEADATGTNVTWQWYVNKGSGFVLSVDDANFSGSATRTLTISNAQASFNNWIFRAVATGVCGVPVNTNFAVLRVVNPPAVTLQPVAKTICENGSAFFRGNGTGYSSLQWQAFSGGSWTNLTDNATYTGANTQQLAIINATVALNGYQYRLALITGCAITYSNGATLTVNANPVVDFSAIDPVAACGGVPIVLNGNPTGGSGTYSQHRWTGDVGPLNSYTVQSPTFNSFITGSYNMNYRVTDSNGCTANDDVVVTVDGPSAQFSKDADYGCTPLNVTFTKDMTGLDKWWWDFGDGSPLDSLNANPVHTFINNVAGSIGYYNVRLRVRSTSGCYAEYTSTITVYPAVDATFTPDVTVICSGNSITFTGLSGATRYFWEYGDGASGYATHISGHLYTNLSTDPVVHTVRLTTTSFYNCVDVKTFDITVMPVPVPQFTADPVTQVFNASGNPVTFTNTTNTGTWNWLWRFGDNTTSVEKDPVHTYINVGTYPVALVVSNANCSDSVKHNVSVVPPAPVADFDSIPSGCVPLYVNINNTSLNTDVPGTTYRWDFGDGSISTAKNPTYTYFTAGIYRIELVVTGPGGTSMETQVVNAYASPKAYFEITPPVVYINDERVRCFNLSQGATSYLWDFGDGDTSKVREPYHRYMEEGVFDITLWAYSENGCTDMYVLSPAVTVEPVGVLRFSTVFTPNKTGAIERSDLPTGGSEADQFFYPPIRQKVLNYKLQIFNRLGVLIFESHDINVPWNGYYKGNLCQQGVYVWYVEGKYADGKPFKMVGNVTLLQ